MSLLSCYRMPLLLFCNFILAAMQEHTVWQPLCLFLGAVFYRTNCGKERGKLQQKSEAAWLADLTNVTVFDNEAFTSCSKDIQIAVFKVMLMELI